MKKIVSLFILYGTTLVAQTYVDKYGTIVSVNGGGGGFSTLTPSGPSLSNWEAANNNELVKVTQAEFEAAVIASSSSYYQAPNSLFASAWSRTQGKIGVALYLGMTDGLTNIWTTTTVPANNYIIGFKVFNTAIANMQIFRGSVDLITMEKVSGYGRKNLARLAHDFTTVDYGTENYYYFLVKNPSLVSTVATVPLLWDGGAFATTLQTDSNSGIIRYANVPNGPNHLASGSMMLMWQVYATPTKSW